MSWGPGVILSLVLLFEDELREEARDDMMAMWVECVMELVME